jgi:hypothetical protein
LELSVKKLEKHEEIKSKQLEELRGQNNILVGKMEGEYCKLKIDLEVRTRETERLLLNNKTLADVIKFIFNKVSNASLYVKL